nr:fibronectin type-III domain-containing protein 3A isoform X1 [Odocoileus virginianus texanus]XP_020759691.1 fibronectin type-III domain-containing protein 3A isoform X1 [Odocoileus virginianus texanus]XP_020759692.1 fibronectin type-III domain-containing protein 3A isoform X1 [Odocoileus virginianus texanus]XP_020759693.1 fibronectin type-III domain-containing protein 3A isoform X1 [Odocoileus virginianus texanus]XP_020759694.1 fibronectin type-III domain-containing protein 3A isoform X1 [Od
MAEHPPLLDTTQILSSDISLLSAPIVSADGTQQVILVQVNPGEAFTIRREDGQFQCITGPAQVPMMSPNGSVPPIYVPPGYAPQVIEDNGVRRVVVVPQAPEFHPGGHTVIHRSPHPPLPGFIPVPAMMPPPPRHMYSPVTGAGDMATQYMPQYQSSQVYGDVDAHSSHGRSNFRDERSSKTYERLQKKLKDRQGTQKDKMSSPPSSPQKCPSPISEHNGLTKGQNASGTNTGSVKNKSGKGKGGVQIDTEIEEKDEETKAFEALLSNIVKPVASDIQARTVVLTWSPPSSLINGETDETTVPELYGYEILLSSTGKDGKYKSVFAGEETSVTLNDLKPATDYHAKVQAEYNSIKGTPSEAETFTTLSCEPDIPNPPRIANRTKNSLTLQWKAPSDNGSKIQSFILEWDEGKGNGDFCQCYMGLQKQFKITKLSPAMGCKFRLSAKNDYGTSGFSEEVLYYTSGCAPSMPASPVLTKAGVTWLSLQWSKPSGTPSDEGISYILEMEEETSGYGFKPKYDGEDLAYTVKNLRRSTKYKFKVIAYNSEGKSSPSEVVEFTTCPDKPGVPVKPSVKGKIHSHSFKITWDPPKDNGGAAINKYVVEMAEGSNGNKWDMIYSGATREHLCDRLNPGCFYRFRVYCISDGGQSAVSESLLVQTPAVPPGPCLPPRLQGRPKAKEIQLRWGPPLVNGGSPISCYGVEMSPVERDEPREVYQGPEVECTVSSLLPGKTYSFRLRAANKMGFGPFSEKHDITTAPGPPDQCKPPQVTCRSATCAQVNWEVPLSNGTDVTEYRLEWGGVEGSMQICYCGPGLNYELKGLSPATTYYCRVQALSIVGAGPFSEVVACMTPPSVPAIVTCLQEISDDDIENPNYSPSTCLAISWGKPCDHGSEILAYSIDFGDKQPLTVGKVTNYILDNLQPDTTYRIRIQALNSLGAGPFSHTIKLKTKPLPPDPPRLECVAFSHQNLKLKWGEGTPKTLSTDSVQYHLQMEDKNGRFVSLYRGPCHTYKVQRLNESTSYKFCIQACNEAGEGPLSQEYIFTTPKSVPAALKAPKIEKVNDHICDITWECLQPMKGDPVIYSLQVMVGKDSEFKQIYRGPDSSFRYSSLQLNCEYRFRVCAIRQCQDPAGHQDLVGPYSTTVLFISQRTEPPASAGRDTVGGSRPGRALSDEQCAAVILVLFAFFSILIAFIIQYFVIK